MQLTKKLIDLKDRIWTDIRLSPSPELIYSGGRITRGQILVVDHHPLIVTHGLNDFRKDDPLGVGLTAKPFNILTELWIWMGEGWAHRLRLWFVWQPLRFLRDDGYFEVPEGTWPGYRAFFSTFSMDPAVRATRINVRAGVATYAQKNAQLVELLSSNSPALGPCSHLCSGRCRRCKI